MTPFPTEVIIATSPPPPLPPIIQITTEQVVFVNTYTQLPTEGSYYIGEKVEVVVESAPFIHSFGQRSDGSMEELGILPWEDHPVKEMQACFSYDVPCELSDAWIPFVVSPNASFVGGSRISFNVPVDWIGSRTLWVVAQYRSADKSLIPAYSNDDYKPQQSQTTVQVPETIEAVWNRATPLADLPAPAQTGVAATQVAYPVTGSVEIARGAGSIGGTAGDTIQIEVAFAATSPFGKVTEMRTCGHCPMDYIETVEWEPFAQLKIYQFYLPINWTTFAVCVQYRDEAGNMSLLYCDDVAVEGMPPTPTPAPTPEWYGQIECFWEDEVQPGPGEFIKGIAVLFTWPDKNDLPEGVYYKVRVFALQPYTQEIASGKTRENWLALRIPPEYYGEFIWIVELVDDVSGYEINHGQCNRIPANMLTVVDPDAIPGIHFWFQWQLPGP